MTTAAVLLIMCASAGAQVSFEQTIADLNAPDVETRLRAVQLLKEAAYPEAAVPLAHALSDADDAVQLEAVAAELNIFLAEKVVPKKRVGLIVEVRTAVSAQAVFEAGDAALNALPVPPEALRALWAASRDENDRVALEALYAFGVLAADREGPARAQTLAEIAPDLAASVGVHDPLHRLGAVRIIARLYAYRPGDRAVPEALGDAVIVALNDRDPDVKLAAMQALGALRYERAVQALTELFQFYTRGPLAEACLDALARIDHASSVPVFAAQLNAKSGPLKIIGIEGLARMGVVEQADAISAALRSERSEAVLLAGQFAAVLLQNGPIDQIAEALLHAKVHDQALRYLAEIAPGRTSAFLRHAQDPDERMRIDIADTLGRCGDPAALRIVEPLLQDRNPEVAAAAARAVARLRGASARRTS